MTADGDQWSVLVPVKRLDIAKTRIAVSDQARADLALAMACDTVSAVLVCTEVAEVVVVTSDDRARHALAALGARVVDDIPDAGLNPALLHGAAQAVMTRVAALSSDLPALRTSDLAAMLVLAADHAVTVVADAAGSGTTLLAARVAGDFAPAFGVDSRAAHVDAGAVDRSADAADSIRLDVDTLAALRSAIELGVGPQTSRAVADLRIDPAEHLR